MAKATQEAQVTNKHPSELKASENGTDITEYAKRVMASQSPDLPKTFILAKVEDALIKQGYEFESVRKVITALAGNIA